MRVGVIAEGFADVNVIKAVLKKLAGIDGSEVRMLRPQEQMDETDLNEQNFSNWKLVFNSCQDEDKLAAFFEDIEGDALLIVHLDTAERGLKGYDIPEPQRIGSTDYTAYSEQLRVQVIQKLETLLPEKYHQYVAYAIAIEETDAWLIPLFENGSKDSSSHAKAKETLSKLVSKDKRLQKAYTDTSKKSLNYKSLGKLFSKNLSTCRTRNKSLDLFCVDIEQKIQGI
jgi:hypothetical protein